MFIEQHRCNHSPSLLPRVRIRRLCVYSLYSPANLVTILCCFSVSLLRLARQDRLSRWTQHDRHSSLSSLLLLIIEIHFPHLAPYTSHLTPHTYLLLCCPSDNLTTEDFPHLKFSVTGEAKLCKILDDCPDIETGRADWLTDLHAWHY